MVDIDQAALGTVASTLLKAAEAHEKTRSVPVGTGLASVDHRALNGGFRHGEITSIAGASGTGKTLLVFQTIASYLISDKNGEVALIDTTGSFSPLRLRNVIISRLSKQSHQSTYQQTGYVYKLLPASSNEGTGDLVEKATSLLDRVKVMRVFDFAGVVEAVGEIGEIWERQVDQVESRLVGMSQERSRIIDDSEEEEASPTDDNVNKSIDVTDTRVGTHTKKSGCIDIIVVDTITNVVSSMVSGSQIQGQALLTSFMRSLHHLTVRRHICTLLTNSAVGLNPSSSSSYPRRSEDNASIFASVLGKPALGKIYKHHIDTSVFLSSIPKTREDAEIAYGGVSSVKCETVGVLEVLSDRYGDREGQWANFKIVDEVEMRNIF